MSERLNRRAEFVEAAAHLFMQQGFVATSVREIAGEVGCTEAALYYHFKDGKRGLLRAVVESYAPDLMGVLDACRGAESLAELVTRCGDALVQIGRQKTAQFRWVSSDFVNFSAEERALIQAKHLAFQRGLTELIQRFIPDHEEANRAAWLVICVAFGYGQLFITQRHADLSSVEPTDLISLLAQALDLWARGCDAQPDDPAGQR